jgi:NADH-quinone oxidoreductase subunit B
VEGSSGSNSPVAAQQGPYSISAVKSSDIRRPTSDSFIANVIRQSTARSLWPLMLGIDYATLELFAAFGPRFDLARFGSEVARPSPRQVDLLIVPGVVNTKLAPIIRGLYETLAEPRFVIALGNGAISGAPFTGSYAVAGGVDSVVPVDMYIPGDPPRPEAIIDGILALTARISAGELDARFGFRGHNAS